MQRNPSIFTRSNEIVSDVALFLPYYDTIVSGGITITADHDRTYLDIAQCFGIHFPASDTDQVAVVEIPSIQLIPRTFESRGFFFCSRFDLCSTASSSSIPSSGLSTLALLFI